MLNSFKIGHFDDGNTGVTAIIAEKGAIGGVSVRGGAPATRETDLLKSENTVQSINAVVLSGGSAFGLEASSGVMQYLFDMGFGYNAGKYNVPIVVGASIYDLENGKFGYPDKDMGYKAAVNAKVDNFVSGKLGGGRGATVGKILGMSCAKQSGLGVAKTKIEGAEIAVISVVNALGDVIDEKGKVLAGVNVGGLNVNAAKAINLKGKIANLSGKNTTISCLITNAKLTKTQMNKICDLAHDGYAMSIIPTHTMYDGDAVFGMASGEVEADYFTLSCAVPKLTAEAIRNAVKNV